jgi:hypothetical protein
MLLRTLSVLPCLVCMVACGSPLQGSGSEGELVAQEALLLRSLARAQPDHGDLRREARQILEAARAHRPLPVFQPISFTKTPATIRVWRHSLGGSDSCTGRVDSLPMEAYVKGVLPHEWITSWEGESLKAGAVAIRTYASYWVVSGGKYKCADLDDTTASQVYKDSTDPKTNQAVDATQGEVLLKGGNLVFAEYSAENSDPTKDGVSDPVCAGKALFGHGHGMCQWGTQRWALQGKDYQWMALHYYSGASLSSGGTSPPIDAGAPRSDLGRSVGDLERTVPVDGGIEPTAPDRDIPGATTPDGRSGLVQVTTLEKDQLTGGCNLSGSAGAPLGLGLLLSLLWIVGARRSPRHR